jgi:hypothetical protein
MPPLTAKLKCPHGNGKHTYGAGAVAEVAFDQDGRREEDDPKGGGGEGGGILPACEAD